MEYNYILMNNVHLRI